MDYLSRAPLTNRARDSAATRALFWGGGVNFVQGRPKIAFFKNTSLLGSFGMEIRKLLATPEAEFSSPVGAGKGSNPIHANFY